MKQNSNRLPSTFHRRHIDRRTVKATRAITTAIFAGIAIVDRLYQIGPYLSGRRACPDVWDLDAGGDRHETVTNRDWSALRVMTLNTAHGRKEGSHRLLNSVGTVRSNLDDVASLLRRMAPDIVGLQETDGPSAWSGMFDHVKYISRRGNFPSAVLGEHVKGKLNVYGTALLSKLSLHDPFSIRFSPAPPTFSKGAVISTVRVPDAGKRNIDVVSLHLDFARKSVRMRQVEELVEGLLNRGNPLIVMGDFNCEWTTGEPSLPFLVKSLDLKPFRPEATTMYTHPSSQRRLDWILLSRELEFLSYRTIQEPLSDHLAVMADVKLAS
ncbi:MAG: endonuclease/exonuclease/phosphatase family protein [Syntrophales bacterium]|jgi:endonuclease/exonuclease/phosphatase family metal-dependent hydrolase|nr:endonuclease/exonuclease/phosphatase family protein [Syntrophales bacterium]MCK9527356.1 endonuclease/exonuclease/phosphatase family protein [Syntrophales bacterium]MDX9921174.1 endonuclease/exonuclease/phosphatase family protein [Syntrophales bacterium]